MGQTWQAIFAIIYNLTHNKVNGFDNFVNLDLISFSLHNVAMNKRTYYLAGIVSAFLLAGAVAGVAPVFADENDDDNEETGERNREESSIGLADESGGDEFEDEDDDEQGGVGGLSGLILYGVIAAVVGTIGYTGYKIFAGRKKAVKANP